MAPAKPVRSSARVAELAQAGSAKRPAPPPSPSSSSSSSVEEEEERVDSGQRTVKEGEERSYARAKAEELDPDMAGSSIQKILEPAEKMLSLLILDASPNVIFENLSQSAKFRNSLSYLRRAFAVELDQLTHEAFIDQSVIYELLKTPNFTCTVVKANLAQLANILFALRNEQTSIEDREMNLLQISRLFPTQFDCSLEDGVELAIEILTQVYIICLSGVSTEEDADGILVNVFATAGDRPLKNKAYAKAHTARLKRLRRLSGNQASLEARYPFHEFLQEMCLFIKRRLAKLSLPDGRLDVENESSSSVEGSVQFIDVTTDHIVAGVMKKDWKPTPRNTAAVRLKEASTRASVRIQGSSDGKKDSSKAFLDKQPGAERVGDVTTSYLSEGSPSLGGTDTQQYVAEDSAPTNGDGSEIEETNGFNGMARDEQVEVILQKRNMFSEIVQKNKEAAIARLRHQRMRRGPRKQWTLEQEGELIRLIGRYGNHWAGLAADHCNPHQILGERGQVELKDKARNLKLNFLKDGRQLPPGFEFVTGRLKE